MFMNPIQLPRSESQLVKYDSADIQNHASGSYRTHKSVLSGKVYKAAEILITPVTKGMYWWVIGSREGHGKGASRGAGGVPKRFAKIKAAAWFSFGLCVLPLILLGIVSKIAFHPGKGRDIVRFMDATKGSIKNYRPPEIDEKGTIHLATFNVASLPSPIDAIKDVLPAQARMLEFVHWIKKQKQENLPLVLGLQEAFDPKGSEVLCNGIKELYPYSITSSGWAKTPLVGGNSGLQFHSRVPIKSAAFYPFDDLDGFGVKCSARGFLRVEVDLGKGKSALIYVTHLQAHALPKHQKIRKDELELIRQQMRYDRYIDGLKGNDRNGHYYLMGDLNVSNVDDEHIYEADKHYGFIGEYNALRQEGQVLSNASFFDPYLVEHTPEGKRIAQAPFFLESDVSNNEREKKEWKRIEEPQGSFYLGPDQKDRGVNGYGTKNFYKGNHPTVANCRYDYILRLNCPEDFRDPARAQKTTGKAEIRHVIPEKTPTSSVSDHLLVSAIFQNAETASV